MNITYMYNKKIMIKIVPVDLGDIVELKKPHACGSNEWEVSKLGMDIGLTCVSCKKQVRLIRHEFDRRFKCYIKQSREPSDR